jgi:hypothetical protein
MENFVSNLKFEKFTFSSLPEYAEKPFEEYQREQVEKNKIRSGTVCRLKNGSTVLIGDLNTHLSSSGASDVEYEEIAEYAYLY